MTNWGVFLVICFVCSSNTFVERAHVRARHSKDENNTLFNLVDLCPTCHTYFDNKLITIHPDWRCWIFSDKAYTNSSYGVKFKNRFAKFAYAYCPKEVSEKFELIDRRNIIWNNENEFVNRSDFAPRMFFSILEQKLKNTELWDYENNSPKLQRIKSIYTTY